MSLCVDIHKSIKIEILIFFTYCTSLLFLIPMTYSSAVVPSRNRFTTTSDTAVDSTTTPDPVADIHALVNDMMKEDPDTKYQLGVAKAGFLLAPKIGNLRKDIVSLRKDIKHKNEELMNKDIVIRELNVLNFIRTHMESFSLQTDPLYYTIKESSASTTSLVTMNKNNILPEDIPAKFNGRLESDFKNAYSRWYRIIKNSEDFRIKVFLKTIKEQHLRDKGPLTDQDIAKALAIIWCTVCNDIHSLLGGAKGQVIWKDENEVANAFATFEENGYYVDVVRIFFKETKFMESIAVTKNVD